MRAVVWLLVFAVVGVVVQGKRFAYVTFFYGDEGHSSFSGMPASHLLSTRVMLRTLQHTNTTQDIVVLVPTSLPDPTEAVLTAEGAIVRRHPKLEVPRGSPELPALIHLRNRLLLWGLEEYDRIIFFDSNHHPVYNVDHLFDCFNFCAVPWSFLQPGSLWVVTPGDSPTRELVASGLQKDRKRKLSLENGMIRSIQEALEAAPLHDPPVSPEDEPSRKSIGAQAPGGGIIHRLHINYNLPYFMFVERLNWRLMRCGRMKNREVPAFVISFSPSQGFVLNQLKPELWWGQLWMVAPPTWVAARNELPPAQEVAFSAASDAGYSQAAVYATMQSMDQSPSYLPLFLGLIIAIAVEASPFNLIARIPGTVSNAPPTVTLMNIPFSIALVVTLFTSWCLFALIPKTCQTSQAWVALVLHEAFFTLAVARWIGLVRRRPMLTRPAMQFLAALVVCVGTFYFVHTSLIPYLGTQHLQFPQAWVAYMSVQVLAVVTALLSKWRLLASQFRGLELSRPLSLSFGRQPDDKTD